MIVSTPVLVTVGITYYRPDFRSILQEFVWQTPDVVPDLTRVHRFLNYWKNNIEAIIERVDVAYSDRGNWRTADWVQELFRSDHA